jgi:cytochrome P450
MSKIGTTVAGTAGAARPGTTAINLPPGPRLPKPLQGLWFATARRSMATYMWKRYGDVFTANVPLFGRTVMVADPRLAKELWTAGYDDIGNNQPNLSRLIGPGSLFGLEGAQHRARRKLLTPPFHGKSVQNYERIFEEETLREAAYWPEGEPFESAESLMRITLNVMLRAVFGADGEQFDELRRIMPDWVMLGCRLTVLPKPSRTLGRRSPWGRLAQYRAQFDVVVNQLIDNATADPDFESRTDILSLLLNSTYDDGSAMSRSDIADELLTLLAAGHETTATTLAWTLERISRHPQVLARLQDEVVAGGGEYRRATCMEVQRTRPIIDLAGRHVYASAFPLGPWVSRRVVRWSWRSTGCMSAPTNSRTRTGSIRNASSAAARRRRSCRSAADCGAAPVRRSPRSRWTSSCEPSCGTSRSNPPMPRRRRSAPAASRTPQRTAHG